ncbi:uncharacterized protein LOC129916801 [Episyrphus balteatus]|uniref:uncharacterized protein LOC129916801 n=1 Tax=Episyrphus balteatus TaxID=286459 RepID=UPI002485C7E1|nr:uncharacterized protein LOC129916801 [Episyrphus balteatus]
MCFVLLGTLSSGLTASIDSKLEMKKSIDNCETEFSFTCLKLEFVKLLERLIERKEIDILPGISLIQDTSVTVQKNTELIAEIARSFPKDPDQRLNAFIVTKFKNFLQSHSLRFKLLTSDDSSSSTEGSVTTGRKGKFHKKGGMEALLAAGLMMKGTLMALGMGTLALIAGKALITGLMALTLSGVIGLKALASSGGKSTTYEIVAKPVYTSSHSHSVSHDEGGHGGHHSGHSGSGYGGGYGRSINLDLPHHLKAPELN